jgi:hypothetical protein
LLDQQGECSLELQSVAAGLPLLPAGVSGPDWGWAGPAGYGFRERGEMDLETGIATVAACVRNQLASGCRRAVNRAGWPDVQSRYQLLGRQGEIDIEEGALGQDQEHAGVGGINRSGGIFDAMSEPAQHCHEARLD